jgi:hypothetical protein
VLFSRDDVASFINKYFEPVWESVRPVPIVHIDFGNGTVLTRTLHGNIATYACTPDGQVLDLVAGIYTPEVYLQRLQQFRLLANYADQEGPAKRADRLRNFHKGQAEALRKKIAPAVLINVADFSKRSIEGGIKAMLVKPGGRLTLALRKPTQTPGAPKLASADDLAAWKMLREDTETNEAVRRLQVHDLLAATTPVAPGKITKRIYKDILHSDLDDPYLGLGKTLFAGYPFKDPATH